MNPRHESKVSAAIGSLVFFVVAPGVVAGLVPWLLTGWDGGHPLPVWARIGGGLLIGLGTTALVHSFVRFVVDGLGTPAPVAPTERLVVRGLYRHVRNPMYLAVVAAILGQGLLLSRPMLLGYGLAAGVIMAIFVKLYEEPKLQSLFGTEYEEYRRAVPGWLPRPRPRSPESSP